MTASTPLSQRPFQALGGQPAFDPADIDAFVDSARIAVLGYVRADGRPNQAPIWYTHRDGTFYMSTTTTGPKRRALERNPRVSLTIQDDRPPYRAVILDGTVTLSPLDVDNDPTDGMAERYFGRLGAATYDRMTREIYEESGLTLITLQPTEVKGFDNTRALSTAERTFMTARRWIPLPRRWL